MRLQVKYLQMRCAIPSTVFVVIVIYDHLHISTEAKELQNNSVVKY